MLPNPQRTTLGPDPTHRTHALNGYAFQQDALHTFNGWQYACFYSSLAGSEEPLFVHLSRRKLPDGPWQTLVFDDYPQKVDDGHNTVQLGICPGDGTIHLSYDHHCDVLRYRHSVVGVATSPNEISSWDRELFTTTQSSLPGLSSPETDELLSYITYPRFVAWGLDLLFTFRTGKAGLGDDHLCVYTATDNTDTAKTSKTGNSKKDTYGYKFLGTHLKGVLNNPYIHGLDVSPSPPSNENNPTLHTTWVYRAFVPYDGWDDPLDTKHKTQAGPNSAFNNHDICYAWSADDGGGAAWRNSNNTVIADLGKGESILPSAEGITAFEIPKGSGLTNQEAQAVDYDGGVHVLNRDSLDDDGVLRWRHYYLSPDKTWKRRKVPHVPGMCGGKRGQLAVSRDGDLYLVLPHHAESVLTILRASKAGAYVDYEVVWRGEGFPPTEPLVDKARLVHDNVLSVFTRGFRAEEEGRDSGSSRSRCVDVVVLDFQL
ncbi:hypothetical protein F4808DRAFT_457942 [Astrocystis sublimbata]|nr:hypothetical protein F4808DRAFT_457942 [Astrocystis sublimbata]